MMATRMPPRMSQRRLPMEVDDAVRSGGGEVCAGSVAVGDGAGAGARTLAHLDVHGHVAHDKGLIGLETQVRHRLEDGLRMGLGMGDAVRAQDIGDVGGQAHLLQELFQGAIAAGRGDRQHVPCLLKRRQRLRHMRKHAGNQRLAILREDGPVRPGAQGDPVRVDAREHLLEPLLQGHADGGGDRLLVLLGIPELRERLPHRQHDVGPRVPEGPVKVQDDELDHGPSRGFARRRSWYRPSR